MRSHSGLQLIFLALLSFFLAACGGGGGGDSDAPSTFSVSGTATGLSGSVTVQNNGTDTLILSDNSGFTFSNSVPDGAAYSVSILNQPAGQTCTVSNGEGIVSGADVNKITVSCSTTGTGMEFSSFTINDGTGPKQIEFSWATPTGTSPSGKILDHYQIFENPDGVSGFTPLAGAEAIAGTATTHEHTIAVHLTDWVNATYIIEGRASDGTVLASAQVGLVSELAAASTGYFKASNTTTTGFKNEFGASIALSEDGKTLAVGAPSEAGKSTGINGDETNEIRDENNELTVDTIFSGAVYVFKRSGGIWAQEAYIKASNAELQDRFGISIALSSDGNTLAVGADIEKSDATGINGNEASNDAFGAGAVYVFSRSDGAWSQEAYVKGSYTHASQQFGSSVALSSDGNTLAVGTPFDLGFEIDPSLDRRGNGAGAVYVFSRIDNTWTQQAYLQASNANFPPGPLDDFIPPLYQMEFGHSVALSSDGSTLAVGAPGEISLATGINGDENNVDGGGGGEEPGAVYVFTRSGISWSQQAYVKASNTGLTDKFGSSVTLSAGGNTLAVGAPGEDSNSTGIDGDEANNEAGNSGAVYVFSRNSEGNWTQAAYLKGSNTEGHSSIRDGLLGGDNFGHSVVLSSDGNSLAVGAIGEDSAATNSGAVYVFSRSESSWMQVAYVKASNPDAGDNFGFSVALSSDGTALAVGGPNEDSAARGIGGEQGNDADAIDAGAVYLY